MQDGERVRPDAEIDALPATGIDAHHEHGEPAGIGDVGDTPFGTTAILDHREDLAGNAVRRWSRVVVEDRETVVDDPGEDAAGQDEDQQQHQRDHDSLA